MVRFWLLDAQWAQIRPLLPDSVPESAAIVDVSSRLRLIPDERYAAANDLLHSIVSMLTRLAKNKGG